MAESAFFPLVSSCPLCEEWRILWGKYEVANVYRVSVGYLLPYNLLQTW